MTETSRLTWTADAKGVRVNSSGLVVVKGATLREVLQNLDLYLVNLDVSGGSSSPGANGKSAYQIWLDAGHSGTPQDFLDSLVGPPGNVVNGADGTDGADGSDGKSAYQTWLDLGHSGTQQDFLNSLVGPPGPDTGLVELAYVENATGVSDQLNAVATDITGLTFTLEQQVRPVYIRAKVVVDVTTSPASANSGDINLLIVDDANNNYEQSIDAIEPGGTNGFITCWIEGRIPPNTPSHTYRIQASKSGNSTFAGQILNGAIGSPLRSWAKALLS